MAPTVLRRLLRDRAVRRLQLAFAGFAVAEYGVWVAVLVFAYQRGGAMAAGTVAVAQLVPAGLLAPLLARSADRRGPDRALRRGYWLQAAALGATALLLLAGAAPALVYAGAVLAATAVSTTRPAQAALVPVLVGAGAGLTAVNVLSAWVDSASLLAGPALAGVLIAVGGPGAAIAAFGACLAVSAALIPAAPAGAAVVPAGGALAAVRARPGIAALVALVGVEFMVIGMLDVLVVVLSIDVLGLGGSGAGYLNAAFGGGALLGSLAAVRLIGRGRLARALLGAALAWATLLVALGAWPTALGAFLLLAGTGGARSLIDVAGRTLLTCATPDGVRARVFGLLEGVATLGLATGSMLVPALLALGGADLALLSAGAVFITVALAAAPRLVRLDYSSSSAAATRASI